MKASEMAAIEACEKARLGAEDMGFCFCEGCGTTYIPHPGYLNNGHQCNENGTLEKFEIKE